MGAGGRTGGGVDAKKNEVPEFTEEQRAVARDMGMTPEEYVKWVRDGDLNEVTE